MSESQARNRLLELLRLYSVQHGRFTLASGQESDVYVDCRLTTLRAEAMPLVGRVILDKVAERGWRVEFVGGLTMGADPVVAAVVRESLDKPQPHNGFLVRKEPKEHGRSQYLEGLLVGTQGPALIVEDVCTTGASAVRAIERAREFGLDVVAAVCLVDRETGGREAIQNAGCGFDRVFTMIELLEQNSGADH